MIGPVIAWSLLLGFALLIFCAELPGYIERLRMDVERRRRTRSR